MTLLFLPLLLAQVGPNATFALDPTTQVPPEMVEQRRMRETPRITLSPILTPTPGAGCVDTVTADPSGSAVAAQAALGRATGDERVRAGMCLGVALGQLDRWSEARAAFIAARDAASNTDHATRARLGAMAGNAALAEGKAAEALPTLIAAQSAATAAGDKDLAGSIAVDRGRALVALARNEDAAAALAEARTAAPDNAQAWLLSATLSRRMSRLDEAQQQIETAARLQPGDADTGLEAGVIAMLAGREDAARRSWQSVLSLAPGSPGAATAKGYLDQLGPEEAAKP